MSALSPTLKIYHHDENLSPIGSFKGKVLNFFGRTVKVWDEPTKTYLYFKKSHLAHALVQSNVKLSRKQITRLNTRILEIANPYNDERKEIKKIEEIFAKFAKRTGSYGEALSVLNQIKKDNSLISQRTYHASLNEIKNELQPGDIIARKYHEDNPNPICSLQKVFGQKGYREAYKCSHIAIYTGEEDDGHAWVAEASMPHKKDPQVRRIRLDDERFALADKNQYMVFRNQNSEDLERIVECAKNNSVKMEQSKEKSEVLGIDDKVREFEYNFIEAARSLWHSRKFDYFAKQRLFKYYADHHNDIPYQYILFKRDFFCSEFVMLSTQLGELDNSQEFAELIKANPPPKSHEEKHKGLLKVIARVWYVMRRAFWCRYMAIKCSKQMENVVKTKLDFLRSSPQDVVNYMMREDTQNYKPLFMVSKAD